MANAHLPIPNLFLAALPEDALNRLRPHLEVMEMPLRKILFEMGQPMPHLYFPDSGMISLLIPLEDGALLEVGVVGKEGFAGLAALFGAETAVHTSMVQLPGTGARIKTDIVRQEMQRSPALLSQVLRYAQALHVQVSQTAVCNVHHTLQERLARWLLMAHDRAASDTLALTQEFLSMMLGVRRPGVTVAATILQQTGAIFYTRGRIAVLDRTRLEAASCECYGMVKEQLDQLLGSTQVLHGAGAPPEGP
jgi:CRP-like cAMP-binding protein